MIHDFAQFQERNNLQARSAWERVAAHRRNVTQLILDASPRGGRLCILGSGNCFDIDLIPLLDRFSHVALYDIDPGAMEFGVGYQLTPDHPDRHRIQCHAIDLCGWTTVPIALLESMEQSAPMWKEILSILAQYSVPLPDSAPFDVVASTCMLSQILIPVMKRTPIDPLQLSIAVHIRRGHLDLMWKLAGNHGALALISDFVATDTAPELAYLRSDQLAEKMMQLIRDGNFFSGVNPRVLAAEIAGHPRVKTGMSRVHVHAPWLWQLYDGRAYLVTAFNVAG